MFYTLQSVNKIYFYKIKTFILHNYIHLYFLVQFWWQNNIHVQFAFHDPSSKHYHMWLGTAQKSLLGADVWMMILRGRSTQIGAKLEGGIIFYGGVPKFYHILNRGATQIWSNARVGHSQVWLVKKTQKSSPPADFWALLMSQTWASTLLYNTIQWAVITSKQSVHIFIRHI